MKPSALFLVGALVAGSAFAPQAFATGIPQPANGTVTASAAGNPDNSQGNAANQDVQDQDVFDSKAHTISGAFKHTGQLSQYAAPISNVAKVVLTEGRLHPQKVSDTINDQVNAYVSAHGGNPDEVRKAITTALAAQIKAIGGLPGGNSQGTSAGTEPQQETRQGGGAPSEGTLVQPNATNGSVSGAPVEQQGTPANDLQKIGDPLVSEAWRLRTLVDGHRYQGDPSPDNAARLGLDNYSAGQFDASAPLLDKAIRGGAVDGDVLTAYGHVALNGGDSELANQAFGAALKYNPNDPDAQALYALSRNRVSTNHLDSALARVGLSDPGKIGSGAFGGGDGARQAAMIQSAANVDPLEQQRRAELAAAAARQQVVPPTKIQQSAAVTKEAAHSLQIGDYPGAYTRATEAISLNNQNAQAWNYRAMADSNMQRYSDAVYDASYSINLEAKQAPPWVTRSWAFAKQGKYKEAEQDARVALEKAPENAYAYHDLAYALAGQGRREEALAALRAAAEQDPRFKEKYEKALQLAQNSDMTLLFADPPKAGAGLPGAPAEPSRGRRFLRLFLLSISGGLIFALAVLHVVSASWREKVNATIRRVLSKGEAAAVAEAATQIEVRGVNDGSGFWQQYEKVRELGAGGMGLVYEAVDKSLDRRVAVKRMRDEIRLDPGEKQRFIQEARMVAALHHPNIVDIYNIVEQDNDVFLVFEYVPGKTLSQRLDDGPLSFAEARGVLSGVCSAVDYAHKQKIIHRDIKPSNIMIREDGAVKVMDFGVARQAKDAMTKMSMTNTVVGTPPYMAPEQEQGTVRLESDVFALGVVLYESLCGELPFQGVGAGMLLNKINGKHEPLSKRCRQALPPGLDEIVAKALHPDPDKRYKTPGELMAAVDSLPVPSAA